MKIKIDKFTRTTIELQGDDFIKIIEERFAEYGQLIGDSGLSGHTFTFSFQKMDMDAECDGSAEPEPAHRFMDRTDWRTTYVLLNGQCTVGIKFNNGTNLMLKYRSGVSEFATVLDCVQVKGGNGYILVVDIGGMPFAVTNADKQPIGEWLCSRLEWIGDMSILKCVDEIREATAAEVSEVKRCSR